MGDLNSRTAETPIASTVHEPFGSPSGPGLFHHKGLQLPAYIQHVAHRLVAQGHDESKAIGMAVGIVKNWAAGHDGKGNRVHPDVQAAASKAVAQWEAAKAGVQRFNPYHAPPGTGGGEFTTAGGAGGGSKSAAKTSSKTASKTSSSKTPASQAAKKATPHSAAKSRLLARAAAYRQQAKELEDQLHTLEDQLKQQQKSASASAKQAAKSKAASKAQSKQQHKQAAQSKHQKAAAHKASHITSKHHKHAAHHKHSAKHVLTLRQKIATLRVKIAALRAKARQLEHQAHNMRSSAEAVFVTETRAALATADINDLPDSAFAFIEPGGSKDASGKTTPRSKRHFPVHDKAHADNAAARIAQGAKFGKEALPKVRAAQKKFGESDSGRSLAVADTERRYTPGLIEVRAVTDDDGGFRIGGYGAVFGKLSRNLGGFVELVGPDAFNSARLDGWPNVVCRFNHDPNMVLGTTSGRTLQLRTDNVGLDYVVDAPQSRADIVELVERGDIQFSSFAFRVAPGGDEWSTTDQNYPMRTLHDVQLVDVAPVLDPAYPDATAGLRSLALAMDADLDEVRSMAEADELRRFFVRTDRSSYAPPKPKVKATAAMMQLMEKRRDPYI